MKFYLQQTKNPNAKTIRVSILGIKISLLIKNTENYLNEEVFHNEWWHGYRSSFHRRLKDTLTIVILSNQLNKSAYHTYKIYQILDKSSTTNREQNEEQFYIINRLYLLYNQLYK